jgi:hypothetical protein
MPLLVSALLPANSIPCCIRCMCCTSAPAMLAVCTLLPWCLLPPLLLLALAVLLLLLLLLRLSRSLSRMCPAMRE